MNSVRHPAILLKTLASALSFLFFTASLSAQTPSFVSFDAPGAGTGSGQGTFVVGMNSTGAIVGNYFDNSFTSHGYVRQPNGYFTELTPPNLSHVFLYGINDSGQVIGNGQLTVPPYGTVGFIRDPDGKYTIVSISGSSNFTVTAINTMARSLDISLDRTTGSMVLSAMP